jgi:hypothetical protein
MSCAFASLQLRLQTVSTGGNTRASQRTRTADRPRKQLEPTQVSARLPLSTEQCMRTRTPSPPGSLLSPASAARPPRGFGGGGALCAGTWRGALKCPRASLRDPLGGVLYAKPARIRRLRINSSEHASRSSAGSTRRSMLVSPMPPRCISSAFQ